MTFFGLDFNNVKPLSAVPVLDKEVVKADFLADIHNVLSYLLPNGKVKGSHYVIGDIDGNKGKSMKISLHGEDAGLYYDHNTGDSGDIFKLWAIKHNLCPNSQFDEVLKTAAEWQGNYSHAPTQYSSEEYEDLGPYTDRYDYHSIEGKIENCVYRYDPPEGKQFRPYNIKTGQMKAPDPRPLYNLPNIAGAEQIIIVEGEKTANALISQNIHATTAMGGANAPIEKTDWSILKDKHIIIWPDNDEAGMHYASKLQEYLLAHGGVGSITKLPIPEGKKKGWDADDALQEGVTLSEFISTQLKNTQQNIPKPNVQSFDLDTLYYDKTPMPDDLISPRLLTPGGFLVIGGAPKVGKSIFLLHFLMRMALGQPFLGFTPPRRLKIFYLQAEIGYHYLRERIQKLPLYPEDIEAIGKSFVATANFKMTLNDFGVQEVYKSIMSHFPDGDIDILCIDPLYNVFDGGENNASENDNMAMFDFLQNKICKLRDMVNPEAGIILSHHTRKMSAKSLAEEPFQAFAGASSLRRFYTSGMMMYCPEGEKVQRQLAFELRNGPSVPHKLVAYINGEWVELDNASTRIVGQEHGSKQDQERDRKRDVIIQIISDGEAFENKRGLGADRTIRDRISALATQGDIKFIKDLERFPADEYPSQTGLLCVENMEFQTEDGEIISLLPTHYKSKNTSKICEMITPEIWEVEDDGDQ